MEKFMYLFRGGMSSQNQSPEVMQAQMQKWNNWMQALAQKGVLVGGEPLAAEGKVLNAKKVVTDGPYTEAKESVGGYIIVNANDINSAVELSKDCPIFEAGGTLEVRQVMKMEL